MWGFVKRLFARPGIQAAAIIAADEAGVDLAVVQGANDAELFLEARQPGDNYLRAYVARLTAEVALRASR